VTGEVVLMVKLDASGSIHYVRIVSGLGHGLDEAAIAAVNQGRCQPATRAGIPVDMDGTITVTFRLT
jgi:TonB family protein